VRPRSGFDLIIAVITKADHCTDVADNEEYFAGLKFINLMR
jgi:hypothetical protein